MLNCGNETVFLYTGAGTTTNPSWPRIAQSLPEISARYGLRLDWVHFDAQFGTIISGPREDLLRFLDDQLLTDSLWYLSKSFKRPFSSQVTKFLIRAVFLTFEDSTCGPLNMLAEQELFQKYGIKFREMFEGNLKAELTGSLWRYNFLLRETIFNDRARFWLNGKLLTGLQVIEELRCMHTTSVDAFDPTDVYMYSLVEAYCRPDTDEGCCISGDAPCEFCAEDQLQ